MRALTVSKSLRQLSVAVLTALLLASTGGAALAAPAPPISSPVVTLPSNANVVVQPQELGIGTHAAFRGLESTLAQVVTAYQAGDQATLATFGNPNINLTQNTARVILQMAISPAAHPSGEPTYETITLPNGRQVTVEHAPQIVIRPDLADAIAATAATYETAYDDMVQVLAPFASLEPLAQIDGVSRVRLPFPAQADQLSPAEMLRGLQPLVGTQTTEGVNLTAINAWHAQGFDGTGVNLAIFDFGFTGWETRQAAGDLPGAGQLLVHDWSASFAFGPPSTAGFVHGTACAEIAYDMAPGATVHLFAAYTEVEFGNAVSDYINNVTGGKKVATYSVGWVNAGPYDGTGSINSIVDGAQTAGILWANSAGNYQKQHHSWTSASFGGTDSVQIGANQYAEYGSTSPNYWIFNPGTNLTAYLEWNDWNVARNGNANRQDYDMRLWEYRSLTPGWFLVAVSTNDQCHLGTVPPTEGLDYTVPSSCGTYPPNYCLYRLEVLRYQVTGTCANNFGHWMSLYTFNGVWQAGSGAVNTFWDYNECNSVTIPADGTSAVATGATFWNEDGLMPLYGLETFSSLGPRNAAGGGTPGAAVNKPDVVAPDLVSTATYGASNGLPYSNAANSGFSGTSAASPHVAGMAASIWEGRPAFTMTQVRSYIETQALYKANGGTCGGNRAPQSGIQNNRYGWGRINVGQPLAVDLASFNAEAQTGSVRLAWETVSELNNTGFNVYRSSAAEGERTPLAFVPSQSPGSTTGAAYTYDDSAVTAGQTYWYWLEDVETSGATTLHGPVSVTYQAPTAVTLNGASASPMEPLAGPGALSVAVAGLAAVAAACLRRRSV